ncbi:MAG: VUT family protein, partial [Opitutaceae bacterium]|nr:VUT family protein [Opitutaceae bacterium]
MNKPASAPVPPRLLLVPVLCMAGIVVLSNFLVRFVINDWLTWAAFSYPVAFFVTDVCNRWAGPSLARRVALAGFATGVACSLLIPGESSARIAFGSGAGFLVSQLLDISVFNTLRRQSWWRAPFIGSALASAVDTVIFFSVAFG